MGDSLINMLFTNVEYVGITFSVRFTCEICDEPKIDYLWLTSLLLCCQNIMTLISGTLNGVAHLIRSVRHRNNQKYHVISDLTEITGFTRGSMTSYTVGAI